MKLDKIANSGNDEYYTPEYAILPLLKYLPKDKKIFIWCPFDTVLSNYVKLFENTPNVEVCSTHISEGTNLDFFKLIKNENWVKNIDYIISNPPYSKKSEVLQALFDSGIKFAMLLGVVGLFESKKRYSMFKNNDFEIMYFNKRISYMKDFFEAKPSLNPPFSSVYITHGILPSKIVFEEVDK